MHRRDSKGGPFEQFLLPPHGATEGLEGFTIVQEDDLAIGSLAALNRAGGRLFAVVERRPPAGPRALFHPLDTRFIAQIDVDRRVIRVTDGGGTALASAPSVTPQRAKSDGEPLIRFIPAELQRLVVAGAGPEPSSWRWALAIVLAVFAAFMLLPAHLIIERVGALGWLLMVVPVGLLGATAWAMSTAAEAERGSPIALGEKVATLPSFLLGSSPWPTKRR
jgi:hypothetical protein